MYGWVPPVNLHGPKHELRTERSCFVRLWNTKLRCHLRPLSTLRCVLDVNSFQGGSLNHPEKTSLRSCSTKLCPQGGRLSLCPPRYPCKPSWSTARAAYWEVVLRENVKHQIKKREVKLSSTFTLHAEVFFRCSLFSGGFVKSFRKKTSLRSSSTKFNPQGGVYLFARLGTPVNLHRAQHELPTERSCFVRLWNTKLSCHLRSL